MDFLFLGAAPVLEEWQARAPTPGVLAGWREGDRRDDYTREVGREAPGSPEEEGAFTRCARAILGYDIFPPTTLERVLARDPVEVGDTVGARFGLVPGLALFFASRVIARFDDQRDGELHKTGFTYQTLEGHPELGEETFSVEKNVTTGAVVVALRSWSRPGTALSRALAPLVRRFQVRGSLAALDHLARRANLPRSAAVEAGSLRP